MEIYFPFHACLLKLWSHGRFESCDDFSPLRGPRFPASPCGGSSRESGVAGRSFLLAESDSFHSCAGNKKDYVSYVMTT